jgi:hypothetical protein
MISTVLFFMLIYRRVTGKRETEKPEAVKKKKAKERK